MKDLSNGDRFLDELQQLLLAVWGGHRASIDLQSLVDSESAPATRARADEDASHFPGRQISANLLRVNHSGEIAAQALYRGQALSSSDDTLRTELLHAAAEEIDHLIWCEQRLGELGDGPSRLRLVWYLGSFSLGTVVGALAPGYALGFVEETEIQVSHHLQKHLRRLPARDWRSAIILTRMRADEERHADWARANQARRPRRAVRKLMAACARLMTGTSYYL